MKKILWQAFHGLKKKLELYSVIGVGGFQSLKEVLAVFGRSLMITIAKVKYVSVTTKLIEIEWDFQIKIGGKSESKQN